MDFLNKAYLQVADLFRSMTPGARIMAVLLAAVVVISLGYLFTHPLGGPSSDLMHGVPIPAGQLPEMEAAFAKANLGRYEIHGTQIFVPRGQEAKYMAALAEANALPPNFGKALNDALSKSNPFESNKERDARLKNAKQEELSLIISSMRGIEQAYVLYDTDVTPGWKKEKIITATATVKREGSANLDDSQVLSIRYLVAGAIAGMKPENVNVTDLNGGRTWHGSPDGGGNAEDNLYVALKRTHEQNLKAKILSALTYIPNVTVEASVELDKKKMSKTREVKHDPKPLVVHQMEESTSRTLNSGGPAGRPGLAAQQPNTAARLASTTSGGNEEESGSKSDTVNIPSGTETETESVGLTPKLAKVSVGIPLNYFKKVWQEKNPDKNKDGKGPDSAALGQILKEEKDKIKEYVAQLLPQAEGVDDPTELVAVEAFQDMPVEELPEPGMGVNILTWLGNSWGLLGMIALAGVSLLMLRSLIKAVPAELPARPLPQMMGMEVPGESLSQNKPLGPSAPSRPAPSSPRLRRFTSGPSLRDELSVVVKEDPDTAANILRNWIGSGG